MERPTDAALRLTRRPVDQDPGYSSRAAKATWAARAADNRLFVDALLYRYRTGIPWRDLPERYGAWKPTHKRYRRWCESGVFARILEALALEADAEYMSIDLTSIRAHQHSAGAQKNTARTKPSDDPVAVRLPKSTPLSMRSATPWRYRSQPVRPPISRRPNPCSIRSRPMRSLPTKAMTATHWSRRFKNAASPQSFLRGKPP